MNNEQKYRAEVDRIKASDAFKENTLALLKQQEEDASAQNSAPAKNKVKWFTPRRIGAVAAAVLVLVGGFAAIRIAMGNGLAQATGAASAAPYAAEAASSAAFGVMYAPEDNVDGAPAPNAAGTSAIPSGYFAQEQASPGTGAKTTPPAIGLASPTEGAMGDETLLLYDFEEYSTDWPLNASATLPETLPVYHNLFMKDETSAIPNGYTEWELQELAGEQAAALGLAVEQYETKILPNDGDAIDFVRAVCGEITIDAYANGDVHILYKAPGNTQSGTAPSLTATYQEHYAFVENLLYEYSFLLAGMQNPQPQVTLSYNSNGAPVWAYRVYDAGHEELEILLQNRSLAGASFDCSDDGTLTGILLTRSSTAQPVGNYPLLTLQQAEKQLSQGNGITFGNAPYPGNAYIAQADLVYCKSDTTEYLAPYYKFYVQLPAQDASLPQGLVLYAAWYVPAIQPQFIA